MQLSKSTSESRRSSIEVNYINREGRESQMLTKIKLPPVLDSAKNAKKISF